jgi:hypothetical protein
VLDQVGRRMHPCAASRAVPTAAAWSR